jgi:hypothetical protein
MTDTISMDVDNESGVDYRVTKQNGDELLVECSAAGSGWFEVGVLRASQLSAFARANEADKTIGVMEKQI